MQPFIRHSHQLFTFVLSCFLSVLPMAVTAQEQSSPVSDSAAILLYHHIADDTPPSTSTTLAQFEAHMSYLKENDFTVWRLDRLLTALRLREPVPEKTVAITFDDGYTSIFETAFPLLQELDFPFTLFVNTQPLNDSQNGYMSWTDVQTLSEAGVMIANHMVDHPHMIDNIGGEDSATRMQRMEAEMLQAEAEIEEHTGQSHRVLAYPYGEYDPAIKQMLARHDFTGIAQNSGAIGPDSDFLALPRFPLASIYAGMEGMRTKANTLAFHVLSQDPESPLTDSRNPAVTLQLAAGNFNPDQLACYAGSETLEIEWTDKEALIFRIQPEQQFNSRRWGYNCTAPARGSNRFHWYSKFWTRSTPENRD